MESINEVIPTEQKLTTINAVKCSHDGAKRIETRLGENKTYCMLCHGDINE